MGKSKLWFSIFDFSFNYKGDEPGFIDENYRWMNEFSLQLADIQAELYAYLRKHPPEVYFNRSMVNEENCWKTISLKWWGIEFRKRQLEFPVTQKILSEFPELISLSFNQLEPMGRIKPHCGDTNAIYRCHFGIEIPSQLPETGFRVKEEWRSWHEGKWLLFMDAYEHEAINLSGKQRLIIVVDFLRPEFQSRKHLVISTVLSSLFLQKRAEKWPILKKTPSWFIKLSAFCLRPFAFAAVKWVNLFRYY